MLLAGDRCSRRAGVCKQCNLIMVPAMNLFEKLRGKKILLIDDDEWIRDSLSLFFESEGCQLLALESAEEAVQALAEQPYDIIIADYKLPGMNGLEFFDCVSTHAGPAIKILITAFTAEDALLDATSRGIQDIIAKPFTTKTIEESLSRLLVKGEEKKALSPGAK